MIQNPKIKSLVFKFAFSLILLLAIPSCVNDDDPDPGSLKVGDSLPAFSVTLNTGETVTSESLRGKVPVIVFFNTSCPDCQKELPVVQKVYKALTASPDVFIMAIAREEGAEAISAYWKENNLTIPWSAQPDRKVYNLFANSVIPRLYIADSKGIITASFGDTNIPSADQLIEAISFAMDY